MDRISALNTPTKHVPGGTVKPTILPIQKAELDAVESALEGMRLFDGVTSKDLRPLLLKSFIIRANSIRLSEYRPHLFKALENITLPDNPFEIAIPFYLIEGGLQYWAHSTDYAHHGLFAQVRAPFFTYDTPFDATGTVDDYEVCTIDGSVGLVFDPIAFDVLCEKYPSMFRSIIKDRNTLNIIWARWFTIISAPTADLKVARLLKTYATYALAETQKPVVDNLSQERIAELLYLSRASVAKAISKMVKAGAIETGYRSIIVNIDMIKRFIADELDKIAMAAE